MNILLVLLVSHPIGIPSYWRSIIGDHIVRKVDGGPDTEENIQSLCLDCNSDKTILAEDWRNKD